LSLLRFLTEGNGATGLFSPYEGTKEMEETGYRYFEDLASMSLYEQVITHHYS
jgi:hypothetical protein